MDGDTVIEPDGWHNIQHAMLGELLDMIGGSVPQEDHLLGRKLNLEVPHAFAGAGLDSALKLCLHGRLLADDHWETCSGFVAR